MSDVLDAVRQNVHERIRSKPDIARRRHQSTSHELDLVRVEGWRQKSVDKDRERRVERRANALEPEDRPVFLRNGLELRAQSSDELTRRGARKVLRSAFRRLQ